MSRKDTIIIAVLVNAGLLIVLFSSALKPSTPKQELAVAPKAEFVEPVIKKESPVQVVDEVDHALHQFATAPAVLAQPPAAAPAMNFADDLKTFTLPENPVAQAIIEEKGAPGYSEVKVKKGDVLEKIARHHHTSVEEIIAANKLSSTNLRIGQTLKIPSKKGSVANAAKPAATTVSTSASEAKYYVVKNGDNPWTIAVKNHMKLEDLLKLNSLDQEKARKLKPGDKLKIQ